MEQNRQKTKEQQSKHFILFFRSPFIGKQIEERYNKTETFFVLCIPSFTSTLVITFVKKQKIQTNTNNLYLNIFFIL